MALVCDRTPLQFQSGFTANGRALPGAAMQLDLLDERLSVSVREVQGADLFKKDRVAVTGDLESGQNWRREMNLDAGLIRSDLMSVNLNAGFSDMRVPYTVGQSMEIGEYSTWEHNRVADTSMTVKMLDGRLAYQSSMFWSQYVMDFDDDGSGEEKEPYDVGTAQWHKFEGEILRSDDLSASVYGLYRNIDPEFRSLRDKSVSVYGADGKKKRLGGRSVLTSDRKTAREMAKSFRTGTYWRPGRTEIAGELEEFGGIVEFGQFDLSGRINSNTEIVSDQLIRESQTSKAKLRLRQSAYALSAWSQQVDTANETEHTLGGRADLFLDQAFGLVGVQPGDKIKSLLPDSLSAHWLQEKGVPLLAGGADRTGTQVGFGIDWEWDMAVTNASISRHVSQSGNLASEAEQAIDYSVDASHTMFGDTWDVTVYLAANQLTSGEAAARVRDLYLGGGVSLWLGMERFPDFIAGVDYNKFTSQDPYFSSLYQDWDVKLGLDFSKYVRITPKDRRTYLNLSYHAQGIALAEDAVEQGNDINHALVLSFATWY